MKALSMQTEHFLCGEDFLLKRRANTLLSEKRKPFGSVRVRLS